MLKEESLKYLVKKNVNPKPKLKNMNRKSDYGDQHRDVKHTLKPAFIMGSCRIPGCSMSISVSMPEKAREDGPSLPPTWEVQMQFQAAVFGLA